MRMLRVCGCAGVQFKVLKVALGWKQAGHGRQAELESKYPDRWLLSRIELVE
jgi:hypothetical protein